MHRKEKLFIKRKASAKRRSFVIAISQISAC